MSDSLYISIVVTVSPSASEMRRFLLGLESQTYFDNFEVVLVDDLGVIKDKNDVFTLPNSLDVRVVETGGVGHLKATVLGFKESRGDVVVSIDPDMEKNIADIPRFLLEKDLGARLIYGVRIFRGDVSVLRFFCSRLYNMMLQIFFCSPVRDINVPMILVSRDLIGDILMYNGEFGYLKLFMPNKLGSKFSEVEIEVVCDKKERSAYSLFSLLALLFSQLKEIFIYRRCVRRNSSKGDRKGGG